MAKILIFQMNCFQVTNEDKKALILKKNKCTFKLNKSWNVLSLMCFCASTSNITIQKLGKKFVQCCNSIILQVENSDEKYISQPRFPSRLLLFVRFLFIFAILYFVFSNERVSSSFELLNCKEIKLFQFVFLL